MTQPLSDRLAQAVILCIAAGVVGFALASLLLAPTFERFDFLYEDFRLNTCLDSHAGGSTVGFAGLTEATQVCYDLIYAQGLLNEFQVRRVNYQTQHLADQMLMWMVIGLTLSGVVLAAVQIIGANRVYIASGGLRPGADNEVSIEAGKIYVKSSVTGVAILVISFAFFFVYVAEVYTIKEAPPVDPAAGTAPAPAPDPIATDDPPPGVGTQVEGGGFGPPPTVEN